jgi:hypothetical protein
MQIRANCQFIWILIQCKYGKICRSKGQRVAVTKKEFKELLKRAGLNQKRFAEVSNVSYNTIRNWQTIPSWVEPFLTNYIKAKTLDSVKEVICEAPAPSPIGPAPAGQSDEVDDG